MYSFIIPTKCAISNIYEVDILIMETYILRVIDMVFIYIFICHFLYTCFLVYEDLYFLWHVYFVYCIMHCICYDKFYI